MLSCSLKWLEHSVAQLEPAAPCPIPVLSTIPSNLWRMHLNLILLLWTGHWVNTGFIGQGTGGPVSVVLHKQLDPVHAGCRYRMLRVLEMDYNSVTQQTCCLCWKLVCCWNLSQYAANAIWMFCNSVIASFYTHQKFPRSYWPDKWRLLKQTILRFQWLLGCGNQSQNSTWKTRCNQSGNSNGKIAVADNDIPHSGK